MKVSLAGSVHEEESLKMEEGHTHTHTLVFEPRGAHDVLSTQSGGSMCLCEDLQLKFCWFWFQPRNSSGSDWTEPPACDPVAHSRPKTSEPAEPNQMEKSK